MVHSNYTAIDTSKPLKQYPTLVDLLSHETLVANPHNSADLILRAIAQESPDYKGGVIFVNLDFDDPCFGHWTVLPFGGQNCLFHDPADALGQEVVRENPPQHQLPTAYFLR